MSKLFCENTGKQYNHENYNATGIIRLFKLETIFVLQLYEIGNF